MYQRFEPVDVSRFENRTFDKNKVTPEEKFWSSFKPFKTPKVLEDFSSHSSFNSVNFSDLNDLVAATGTSVLLYDASTGAMKRTIGKAKSTVFIAKIRHDGNVIASGEEKGRIKIFDSERGNMLRDFKLHKLAVKSLTWLSDGKLLSGSDDKSAALWDISTGEPITKFDGHQDFIRSSSEFNKQVLTGSYDGTVKLWDPLSARSVLDFKYNSPVECIITFDDLIVASSGNGIKILDSRKSGENLINSFTNIHQKAISSMVCDADNSRLLTASLDGFVAVNSLDKSFSKLNCVSRLSLDSELLSIDLKKDNSCFAAALLSGKIDFRKRSLGLDEGVDVSEEYKDLDYFQALEKQRKLLGDAPSDSKKRRLEGESYDIALKKFEYKTALTEALKSGKPHIVVAVLEELEQRNGLAAGLKNRDEMDLELLVSFLTKFVIDPKFSSSLIPICEQVMAIYQNDPILQRSLVKLRREIKVELETMDNLQRMCGVVELLLNAV